MAPSRLPFSQLFLQHHHVSHESKWGESSCHTRDQIFYNFLCWLESFFLGPLIDCSQEFVSYYGKNTTAPELAAKILSAVDDFKKA
jgi:hypothetical protein